MNKYGDKTKYSLNSIKQFRSISSNSIKGEKIKKDYMLSSGGLNQPQPSEFWFRVMASIGCGLHHNENSWMPGMIQHIL